MFMKKDSIESSKFQVSTILALGLSILRFFFASSDSNLYNSIATAIDPDASSSCIAKLPTYLHVLRGIRKGSGHTQTYLVQSFNFTKNNTVIFSKYNSIGNSQKIRLLDTACGK